MDSILFKVFFLVDECILSIYKTYKYKKTLKKLLHFASDRNVNMRFSNGRLILP